MTTSMFQTAAFVAALSVSASAADPAAQLNVFHETDPGGIKLTAQLRGASGSAWGLLVGVGAEFVQSEALVIDIGSLDPQGDGDLSYVLSESAIPTEGSLSFAAVYLGAQGGAVFSEPSDYQFGMQPECDRIDFEFALGADDDVEMVAGRQITDQWADSGIAVSARNNHGGHPDKAILFDSDNPTGGDDDLGVGLGNILIVAENDVDADDDALVDEPDDEAYGGSLIFDFLAPSRICGVDLADIDEDPGTELRFFGGGDTVTPFVTIPVISMGDGSLQTVVTDIQGVTRFEVYFEGSGAIAGIDLVTCPRLINFDENAVGQPLDLSVGEAITDQFQHLGVQISVINAFTGNDQLQNHPDTGILFDTQNPTGDDPDLATPQPGVFGNDTPLGKVLIIAEDDIDADNDGLVDDPDDEAAGGAVIFAFDEPMTVFSVRVLDTDDTQEDTISLLDENDVPLVADVVLPDKEDGAVQLVELGVSGVRTMIVNLAGSGAVTRLRFCPDSELE